MAAAALAHSALSGAIAPSVHAAVLVPTLAWRCCGSPWPVLHSPHEPATPGEAVGIMLRCVLGAFEGFALGTTIGGVVLLALFSFGFVRQLRDSRQGSRSATVACGSRSARVVGPRSRELSATSLRHDTFRYQVTGSVFVARSPLCQPARGRCMSAPHLRRRASSDGRARRDLVHRRWSARGRPCTRTWVPCGGLRGPPGLRPVTRRARSCSPWPSSPDVFPDGLPQRTVLLSPWSATNLDAQELARRPGLYLYARREDLRQHRHLPDDRRWEQQAILDDR